MARSTKPPSRGRTPSGRRSQRHATPKSVETHRKIIEAAIDCFVEVGYHRTTMSRIAAEAGVTRGCMQYYFPSTASVLSAAADYLAKKLWGGHLVEILRGSGGAESLERALDHFFDLRSDRYYVAWIELVAASRTEASLRPLISKGYAAAEGVRRQASELLFGPGADVDDSDYQAVADLVRLVTEALTLSPPSDETRTRAVISAVKAEAYALWARAKSRRTNDVRRTGASRAEAGS